MTFDAVRYLVAESRVKQWELADIQDKADDICMKYKNVV